MVTVGIVGQYLVSIHSSTSNLAVVLQADNYLFTIEISADYISKTVDWETGQRVASTHALNSQMHMSRRFAAPQALCVNRK